jgi:TatD DNase family protein
METKYLNYLALARNGGRAELGEEPVGAVARALKAHLIIVAGDASDHTWRRAKSFAAGTDQQCIRLGCTKDEMGFVVGRQSLAIAAITDAQLALAAAHPDCLGVALGVHPTRCVRVPLRKCRLLRQYAEQNHPLAIGETGLDYHLDREEQHRLRQRFWFAYQLRLADRLRLPLVLHVRDADDDALRILRRNRKRIHGGVVHCFTGTPEHAMAYRELGLHIGIGGKLLWDNEESARLCEAIRRLPLEAILVETDAPLVLPDIGKPDCSRSQRRRLRNSSLILPAVIERIASLHGVSPETVEQTVCRNTLRLFRIEIEQGGNCHVQN